MWKKIKNFFLSVFAKPAIEEGGEALEVVLRKVAATRPKLFKLLVVVNYSAAKVYGPDLVASTATDLDDKGLEEFLDAIETVAKEVGLDLKTIDLESDDALPTV